MRPSSSRRDARFFRVRETPWKSDRSLRTPSSWCGTSYMNQDLVPHLFRREYSKIVAVLVRNFGLEKIEVAEDIASQTFLAAMQSWTYVGVPQNPSAWIYAVAKNKARNHL